MAASKAECGVWFKRKELGKDVIQWIWKFDRPFSERPMWDSRATVRGNAMEIWFNFRPGGIADCRRTEKALKKEFRRLFNVKDRDICEVFSMLGFARVAYYCRVERPPAKEFMEQVEAVVERCYVEAEVDRYDAKTGEYQGTFFLTEFNNDQRVRITKHIEGDKRFKAPLGSKWRYVD